MSEVDAGARFTAFVAVDRREVVNAGGDAKKVTQAVEENEELAKTVRRLEEAYDEDLLLREDGEEES